MVYSPRIGPDGAFVREIKDIKQRISSFETRPAGQIVIRETLTTEDPVTGVKTIIGQLPDGTNGIQPFVGDITPPPVATTPIATAQPGIITVTWDGLFVNNEEKPRDFEHVNVVGHKLVNGSILSSVVVGVLRLSSDTVLVTQDIAAIGETWQFSLESEDYNGNKAALSAKTATITMLSAATDEGVNAALGQINQSVISTQSAAASAQTAANNAQKAADDAAKAASDAAGVAASKSKVLIQPSAPAAADQNSNVLWIDTTNGLNAPKRWNGTTWVVVTDKAATDAAAAAAAAQTKADQAFNNAATAAQAAGQAQTTADGKNSSYYLPSAPAGTGFKTGDQWFDTSNNYALKVWNGSSWITAQDAALAKQIADSKALVYTQPTVPPVEARVASTVWNDTSLGLDKVVVKYWNGTAWTPLADKTATDAAAVADSKGETIYSSTEPAVSKRLPQNTWVDTTGGINIVKRWDGSAWVVAADSRIASTATAVTAAQKTADDATASAASKSIVFTQSVTPPVSARLPQTLWNDTSLGVNNVVVKYWDGNAWTAMADKVATDAAAVAATKTKTYFQPNQPSNTGNTTGDLWFDTDDLNRPYVWNGSAWTLAQDATVNKSLFASFPTDIDNTQPNKWMFTRYNKTMAGNTVVPTYLDIAGISGTSSLVADGANLVNTVGDNYVGQLRTIVNVVSAKTIAVTATHDDAAQIYVDGVSVYSKGAYTQNAAISFSLSAGWHVIDLLWTEITGGDGWFNISPTFGSQVTSMFAPVALSSLSAAVSSAQSSADAAAASAQTAMNAQSYSLNASFDDWTGTAPAGYSNWTNGPVKETSIVRRAPYAARFNVPDATTGYGLAFSSVLAHAPNLEYFTVELDFYLVSGSLGAAGFLLDWNGLTNNRAQFNLATEVPNAVTGKWYRVSKVLRRPTNSTGTWTGMGGYLMGQYTSLGTGAAKNIIFDWMNVRPSTTEEILAYNAPADAQTKANTAQTNAINAAATDASTKAAQAKADAIAAAASDATLKADQAELDAITAAAVTAQQKADAAQAAAISAAASDATTKANTAQQNAIDSAQVKIDQVWAAARSYINPATNTTGLVAKQGVIPTVVDSVSAMGGKALQKSGSVNAWLEDTNGKQAYDPTAVYRFSIRVRITTAASSGGTGFYWGLVGLAADKTTYVNVSGANSYSSQQWMIQNSKPATNGQWIDYVVYYKGVSTSTPSGAGTVLDPRKVHVDTKFFMPGMILDYPNGNGVWEVSHWSVDVIDQAGYQALVDAANAKTDAIAAAATDATNKANAAQQAAITAAATDAANKAAAAQQAAIDAAALDASAKAAQAEADALTAAAADAQTKADAAEQAAIDAAAITAQLKADGAEQAAIDAAATDAAAKAAAAQQAAIDAAAITAQAKADAAQAAAISAAATDAQTRATQAKADAISAAAIDAATKADAAQMAAIQAQAYQLNPSFEDWTGTIPASYTTFVNNPTKETTTVRTGKNAVRFNCTDTTTQKGLQFNAALAHAPYFEYLTVEIDVRLDSGSTFAGSGVLVDWTGMTGGNRVTISLATEIPAPVVGKWYRVVKVIRKPATATGTFTNYSAWLMGQYSSGMGTMSVKNVIFDWINVRPATTEEITAYGTPASIQSLSDTVNTKTKSWFQPSQPPLTGNTTGDLWFDTDDNNKVYIWNGAWSVASDQRIEALNTSVSSIQTTANGKNKVIYSTSAASGTTGFVAGDTWFQRDASNNIIGQWEFTTSWQSRKVDDAMIANLNAAKIIAGTLDAQRIGANSLTAGKLMVSDMEELIPNPFFHPNSEPVLTTGGMSVVSTASSEVSAGAPYPYAVRIQARDNHPFATPNIAVRPGDQFYMEAWVCAAPTTTRPFNFYIFGSSVPVGSLSAKFASGQAVTGTWVKKTYSFTVPLNATYTYIKPVLQVETVGGDTSDKWVWYVTGWSMRRKNTGELIVDGAIKANSAIIEDGAIGNAHIGDAAVDTAEIKDAAIKTAKIDDLAVTDGKISSLNAGKITAGYLDARVIQAGSIKADKLDVTLGGNNLVYNSSFEVDSNNDGLADGWNTWARGSGDASRTFANTRPAGLFPGSTYAQRVTSNNISNTEQSSIQSSTLFSIAAGASATISLYGRASVAGNFPISIRCEDDTGAYKGDASFIAAFTTSTQRFVGTVITPAGTTRAKVTITTPGSLTSGHWFEVDGVKCELGDVVSAWSPAVAELLPGTIVGNFLKADAIDGMIITGSTIQTTSTANRGIKLTPTELAGYDNSGNKNFSLLSSGSLSLKGDLTSGSTITGATVTGSTVQTEATAARGIKLTTTELAGYDTSGNKNFSLTTGGTLTIKGDITAGSTITGATITGATVQTEVTAARGIKLTSTEFAGYDTTGAKNFSLTSAGVLSLKGSIESGSTIKGATLAAGTGGIETSSTVNRGIKIKDTGIWAYDGSGNLTYKLDATTGYVEVPGLKANSITGTMIASDAIAARHVAIGDFTNLYTSPQHLAETGGVLLGGSATLYSGAEVPPIGLAANIGTRDHVGTEKISVRPGDQFYIEFTAKRISGTAALNAGIWVTTMTGGVSAGWSQWSGLNGSMTQIADLGNGWARYKANPYVDSTWAGVSWAQIYFQIGQNSPYGTNWLISDVLWRRKDGGELIVDGAIDGKIITGATVQTEKTANRGIKLTSTELAGYDTNGVKNLSLTSAGALTLKGAIQSGSTITGTQVTGSDGIQTSTSATAGVKLTNTGIKAWDTNNNLTFHLDASTGYLELPGLKANSINGDRIQAGSLTSAQIRVGDFTNLVTNGFGELGAGIGWGANLIYDTVDKPSVAVGAFDSTAGQGTYNPPQIFWDVTPNTEYTTEIWLKADKPNSRIYVELRDQAGNQGTTGVDLDTGISQGSYALSNVLVPTTWTKFTIKSTTTSAATKLRVGSIYFNHTNGTERTATVSMAMSVRRRVQGNLLVDGSITTNHMTSGTIDGGVIKAGSLSAMQIKSKSITVDKLVVSSTNNLVVEADFGNGGTSWGTLNANKLITTNTGRNGLPALRVTGTTTTQTISNLANKVTVGTEDRFRGSFYINSSAAAASGAVKLYMKAYSSATSSVPVLVATSQAVSANTWTLVEGYSDAFPSGVTSVEFYLEVTNAATGTTLDIDYVSVTRAADARLVVDGAIDGKTITGAVIQTASPALSGARLVMDSTGLRGWDASNKQYLSAAANGLAVTGTLGATGDGVDYSIYDSTTGQYGSRPVNVSIGGAAGVVGLGYGGQTWPYPSPLIQGQSIPGIAFRPTSVAMYDLAAITARDGVTMSIQSGVTQADFDAWAAQTDGSGQLVNARKSYMPTIMTLNQNGVNFSKYVEAPEYRIGGTSLSTASVVTYTGGGTINNQTVTKLAGFTRRDDASTDTFLFTLASNGYEFVARDTGVYDLFVQFAIGGPASGRSFVELSQTSDNWGSARAFFGAQEDTQSVTMNGIKMTAGQKFSVQAFVTLGSGSINTGYTVRITKKAAPLPVKAWGEGDITQTGNVTVQGDFFAKPKFAHFYNNGFQVASGSATWDSGPVTMDTAKSKNNDFAVAGPYAGSVSFTKSGWYMVSHFIMPTAGSPMDSWARLWLGSTGENLCQDGNRPQSEIYLSTVPIYVNAGDYIRCMVVSPGGFTSTSWWKIAQMPWSNA